MSGGGEHKVKAVLNIGGEISSTLKGSFNLLTGNISKIGTLANKHIKGEFKNSVIAANKAVTDLKNEIKRTGDASGALALKLEAANAAHDRAKKITESYRLTGQAVGQVARGLAVVTAEAAAAGWAMYHLTEKYDEHVMASRNGGKVLSLSAQSFAEFHSAAGKFADPAEKAFKLFQGNMSAGSKKTFSALQAIGIDPQSLKGTTNLEAFLRVAEKLKQMADKGQSVTGVTRAIMGRGGADALPFLLKGRTEIERLMQEAKAMGIAPSKEDEAKVADYARVMARADRAVLGMKLSIGQAFLPVMERLGETISDFVVQHGPEVRKWAEELGQAIEKHIPTVEDLESAFHALGNAVKWATEHTTAMKWVLGAVVAMPFLPFIASLLKIISLFGEMGIASGVLSGMTMGLGKLAATALPLAALGVQLFIVAQGYQAVLNVMKEWEANKSILTDMSAWKDYGKQFLQSDPILKNFFGGKSDEEEILSHRKTRGSSTSPDPSALFRSPSPAAGSTRNYNPVFHFNVTAAPGMDAHSVADMVMNKLDGRMSAMASGALFD